jgi:tetratricopeptide (TPR) repeat protein
MPVAKTSKDTKDTKKPESKTAAAKAAAKEQSALFEKAMAAFHKRDFAKARELFGEVAGGPSAELNHAAAMHQKMCERRLGAAKAPTSPEEHYTLAVALMNSGDLDKASEHLNKALAGDSKAAHFHYARALCSGMQGDLEACYSHLSKAIEIEPSNRVAARNDADFQSFARQSPLRELLNPERASSA